MFSAGQINFAIFFIIVFSIAIFFMYRKDLKELKNQYKGIYWVLLLFLTFVGLLFLIKQFLMD
jgi:4-amino-4-deoxy-L-arabinose transferase-like glycosyltransferase